ncbi:MAG TPA: SNF2-related protein [Burkholderiaceae bacterium]|nr:SNF2-related protein [Burkholderiaceae bacterium]
MYTPYQGAYLAHWLSLDGASGQGLTQAIASAKVDMNPHQVDAALFALGSPLSHGVLLADEVGLGKTIEASLVLAQKWAERKRKLMLIVPATLRKQWSQELEEKFSLRSVILEAKNFNAARKSGADNPFDVKATFGEQAIVICSYEFASRNDADLARVPWDMVVLDEAHKLRNVYKNDGAKIAKKLDIALKNTSKILLSATPMQNNLLELYGLISIIDPYLFGDLESFKVQYCHPKLDDAELTELRDRLKTICKRTLRRQVQEEGGIRFTRRYSMTEDFTPTASELALYEDISTYLQSDDSLAMKTGARHLVTQVIRKILASSSYAIQGTLATMIDRLEKKMPLVDALKDYDALDDLADAEGVEESDLFDPVALQAEIDQLKNFQTLASSITENAKANALLRVLDKAFDFAQRLGSARKAVIFTESVRTQAWLADLLTSQAAYRDRVVLLNGSNNDETSRHIYQAWLQRHQGSSRISGSKSADMKAALVDKFRDDASIMICTEAGAEGINLQFCSLLINYDLPWNPQRVEQRIGRVHRYGQKHDVVVVNFINKGNRADERVFELLSQKFQLFEGVFGASDEILGAIESGVDIERRILDIYQKCRNDEQIEAEFNLLQETLKSQLDARNQQARLSLLDNFDEDVVRRLNLTRDKTSHELSVYQERLLLLAKMQLPQAIFDEHRFQYDGHWHDVNWKRAEDTDARFFQPHEGIGKTLIKEAKAALVDHGTAELAFDYTASHNGQYSDLRHLIGQSGELAVEKFSIGTVGQVENHLLLTARTDSGDILDAKTCERLLLLPARIMSPQAVLQHDTALTVQLATQRTSHLQAAEKNSQRYYEEETEKLDRWAEDRRIALDIRIKQLDQDIKEARKAARLLPTLQDKIEAKKVLKQLERARDNAMLNYHEEKKKIESEEDRLLTDIEDALHLTPQHERLFALRWHLKGTHD